MNRVLLVGMMGVGKSTVGRILARRIGGTYLDNDDLVEQATGARLAGLLERAGPQQLRRAESAALGVALAAAPPLVAGIAGGVVDDPDDRARLLAAAAQGDVVVWLRARPETLAARIAADERAGMHRPWLAGDPLGVLRQMDAERSPRYAGIAGVTVDVDDRTAEQVAATVATAMGLSGAAEGTGPADRG